MTIAKRPNSSGSAFNCTAIWGIYSNRIIKNRNGHYYRRIVITFGFAVIAIALLLIIGSNESSSSWLTSLQATNTTSGATNTISPELKKEQEENLKQQQQDGNEDDTSKNKIPMKRKTTCRTIVRRRAGDNTAIASTAARVIMWMPGYPGSGFSILEQIIPKVTGLPLSTVYYHHTCTSPWARSTAISSTTGAPPIGSICVSHYPFIQRDAPIEIEVIDSKKGTPTNNYYRDVLFVMRNPALAIPSYFTRWYGTQQHIHRNHAQPPLIEWKKWRNSKLNLHLQFWKSVLVTWHDGLSSTSKDNKNNAGDEEIGMYVPYELLIDSNQGPKLLKSITTYFDHLSNTTTSILSVNTTNTTVIPTDDTDYTCYWKDIVVTELNPNPESAWQISKKEYNWTYTISQRDAIIKVLDDVLALYSTTDAVLSNLLKYYKHDIKTNIAIEV